MIPVTPDKSVVYSTAQSAQWNNVLASFPEEFQDIHFTAAYHQLYEKNGDGEARLFVYTEGGERYAYSFLLRPIDPQWVGNGYYDIETPYGYGGPISSSEDRSFLVNANRAFATYCNDNHIVSEFVRFHPLLRNYRFIPPGGNMKVIHLRDYLTVNLKKSPQESEDDYLPKNRTVLRKAAKEGIHIVMDATCSQFDVFMDIYLAKMRELGAARTYFFSAPYFRALRQLVQQSGVLLLAVGPKGIVGGAVFLISGKWAHYFLAAVTAEGRSSGAGNLLLHEGINHARSKGASVMHIGGGVTSDEKDSLLQFKRCFTQDTVPFHIGKRIHHEELYNAVCRKWDEKFAPLSKEYAAILQRYRFTAQDLHVS
jgi:hypothetical protein